MLYRLALFRTIRCLLRVTTLCKPKVNYHTIVDYSMHYHVLELLCAHSPLNCHLARDVGKSSRRAVAARTMRGE